MTSRQLYESILIELNKVNAPSILLEDFNYLVNKVIQQYINKWYSAYDSNQQTTDNLRVLKATAKLPVTERGDVKDPVYGYAYQFDLPSDYLHLLNCICNFTPKQEAKCADPNRCYQYGATRLVADIVPEIINNYYFKPTYKKPYYYIHNINNTAGEETVGTISNPPSSELFGPTNPVTEGRGTDITLDGIYIQTKDTPAWTDTTKGLPRTLKLSDGREIDAVNRAAQIRYGNPSNVRLEIRFGKDNQPYQLDSVYIDYLKSPQFIKLTQDELDLIEDTSQMIEFPDYVCYEIINALVQLIMENTSNVARIQSNMTVNQSIAPPGAQQQMG